MKKIEKAQKMHDRTKKLNTSKEWIVKDFCPRDYGLSDNGGCDTHEDCEDCWNHEIGNNKSMCEYCEGNESLTYGYEQKLADVEIDGDLICIESQCFEDCIQIVINFCPMCGRQLKEV